MDCSRCRRAISARIDGEPVDEEAIEAHLERCAACHRWQEGAHELARAGLHAAGETPGQSDPDIVPPGFVLSRWLRVMLAWTGLVSLGWNLPAVFDVANAGAVHLARHQSAFSVALAIAFLVVAWRPDRAYGLVPFSVTFTLALGVTAIVDLVSGSATVGRESLHLLELAGLAMLWILGVRVGPGRTALRRHGGGGSRLV